MNETQLILYDDDVARSWFPFTLTRPAGELRFGAYTLRERAEKVFGLKCAGYIADGALADFDEPGAPPVLELERLDTGAKRIFVNSRIALQRPDALAIPAGAPNPSPQALQQFEPRSGLYLQRVWELMTRNTEQLSIDLAALPTAKLPGGVAALGKPALILGQNVTIEPQVVFDFSAGPIWLDDDVTVRAFTRLAGPSYIGKGTMLLGGSFSAVSFGPRCKIRGEVESTVVLANSNKAHDGFLGHAYLGMWVNLGALTTNSDLKNNYGSIRLKLPTGEVNTGELKLGCLLGDHVKTAIGTMLNTGTVIGPGSNIFGGMPDKLVPAFSWGSGEYEFEKFIATAEVVLARRQQTLTEKQRKHLHTAWQRGRSLAAR